MLRLLIAAMLLLASTTSAAAESSNHRAEGVTVPLRIGARTGGEVSAPAVHAGRPSRVTLRTINGVALAERSGGDEPGMLALLHIRGDAQGLAVPVSETVSLGLGYAYLRREDIHLEVAETGSLHEEYSTHNVVLRAHWKF